MEINAKISQNIERFSQWLSEQVWFQQIKDHWNDLDPEHRRIAQWAGTALGILTFVIWIGSIYFGVSSLKSELEDKNDLLSLLQHAQEEVQAIEKMTGVSPSDGESSGIARDWNSHFQSAASQAQIDSSKITVTPGASSDTHPLVKEQLYDVALNRISIRQVTRFVYFVENGPVKIRNFKMDTDGGEGHVNLNLALSAFSLKTKEEK